MLFLQELRMNQQIIDNAIALVYRNEGDLLPDISNGSNRTLEFHCSAVGCVAIEKMQIRNKLAKSGRCKRCGGKRAPICPDKIKHVLPARVHDLLRWEHNNGLSLEALVEAASGSIDPTQLPAVRFWANLYEQGWAFSPKNEISL